LPFTSAIVTGGIGPNQAFYGTAAVTYFLSFPGPAGNIPVQLSKNVSLAVTSDNTNVSANTGLALTDGYNGFAGYCFDFQTGCDLKTDSFSGILKATLVANSVYELDLNTSLLLHDNSTTGGASASAFVDSFIFIDPNFGNAGAYNLVLSDGIVNADSSVPEPSTWALAGLGLAEIIWTAQKRLRD